MLIARNKDQGVCFAWTPKHVPEGLVWLEWVHYRYIDNGFSDWEYARWIPERQYTKEDKRRHFSSDDWAQEQEKLFAERALHSHYETPPNPDACRNIRRDGPTPCWYPHCTCMNAGGSTCGGGVRVANLDSFERPDQVDAERGR